MKKSSIIVIVLIVIGAFAAIQFSDSFGSYGNDYIIETSFGDMKIKLYDETPKHRDNFIQNVKLKAYNNSTFSAIYPNEVIVGGDIKSEGEEVNLDAEISDKVFAKKGAIVAVVDRNSAGTLPDQFFIVTGDVYTKESLIEIEKEQLLGMIIQDPKNATLYENYQKYAQAHKEDSMAAIVGQLKVQADELYKAGIGKKFSKEQIDVYTTIGGMPKMDGQFTIFGQVVEGLEILEKIAKAKVDQQGKPVEEISMKIKRD